jgi:hypothetical protein
MAQINSLTQTWSLVQGSTWLLTSTAVFSDKDERTLKMRIERGETTLDDAFAARQALVQGIHFNVFMDCLKAKNERPVTVASSWTDISQQGEQFVYDIIVNFSNWLRERYHFEFDHYPTADERAQMEAQKEALVAETLEGFNDWADDASLTAHHLLARFHGLGNDVEVRGPYTEEEIAARKAADEALGEAKVAERERREAFLKTLQPPTPEEWARIRQLAAEGKIPHRDMSKKD